MDNIYSPTPQNIENAIIALKSGGLIGLPTETVYGLGGDATNPKAIAKIFETKNRPNFNPLISHITGLDMAMEYGVFSPTAVKIADKFWPAPLTIVVPRRHDCNVCDLACAGLETIALRAPNHQTAQEIIKRFGKPIAAPSANISGSISPTCAQDVYDELGNTLDIIIDGGKCEIGLESTVIAVFHDEVTILRHGFIDAQMIENIINKKVHIADLNDENAPQSPGMLLRHYSPKAKVILNASSADDTDIFIAFGDAPKNIICPIIQLSSSQNLTEAAANIYSAMRMADAQTNAKIAIAPIPNIGIGIAINDRLSRAAN